MVEAGAPYTEEVAAMSENTKISRVVLRNYKSIRECDVPLGPITFLVGPNGAGKSNFLEALRFLSFGLDISLEPALDSRSGFRSILHQGADAASGISFEVFFALGEEKTGSYLVDIAAVGDGPATVIREECSIQWEQSSQFFKMRDGVVTSNQGLMPAVSREKLYLANASGVPAFEPVYRALSSIVVYNPVPDEIRGFKPAKVYASLDETGSALAQTIYALKTSSPERLTRVIDYLRRINPSVIDIDAAVIESTYRLRFVLDRGSSIHGQFPTQNISDGTLRALAILVALFQKTDGRPITLVGLEEPEAGLHPAAAGVLFDSLIEGSRFRQVVVTSHSPDLLDREDIPENSLKAVAMCDGRTIIGDVDETGRAALRERLYTAGELMPMDQLRPEGIPDCANAR
jgi:predicted ATPase